MPKGKITLLPNEIAKKGEKFIPISNGDECDRCNVKNACIGNIEPGRAYKVIDTRSKTHTCEVTNGKVRVVEVKEPPLKLVTEIHNEFVGSVKTFHPTDCSFEHCKYREFCVDPPGIREGDLVEITEIVKSVECKKGEKKFVIQVKRRR